jgi:hypothetical protein
MIVIQFFLTSTISPVSVSGLLFAAAAAACLGNAMDSDREDIPPVRTGR